MNFLYTRKISTALGLVYTQGSQNIHGEFYRTIIQSAASAVIVFPIRMGEKNVPESHDRFAVIAVRQVYVRDIHLSGRLNIYTPPF